VTETEVVSQGLSELSDAVVAKASDPGNISKSLTDLLPDEICVSLGSIPEVLALLAETASQ
jgi:hypothetical protein